MLVLSSSIRYVWLIPGAAAECHIVRGGNAVRVRRVEACRFARIHRTGATANVVDALATVCDSCGQRLARCDTAWCVDTRDGVADEGQVCVSCLDPVEHFLCGKHVGGDLGLRWGISICTRVVVLGHTNSWHCCRNRHEGRERELELHCASKRSGTVSLLLSERMVFLTFRAALIFSSQGPITAYMYPFGLWSTARQLTE